jgi:hydrogenase nickel incorporation protein HypB
MVTKTIEVHRDIRAEQLAASDAFREVMTRRGTYVVRLISSPGAGKTKLLEATAQRLTRTWKLGILVGDVETERDAARLAPFAPTVQLTTGGACHLELPLVERGLARLGQHKLDFLFIEDVGNLICPASHDLGEHLRVILLSTTEGDDKPGKYPKAFRTSDVLILNKTDLLPHVQFVLKNAEEDARRINPDLAVFALSAWTGEGVDAWCEFVEAERTTQLESAKRHARNFGRTTRHPGSPKRLIPELHSDPN